MVARVDGRRRYPRFARATIEWLNDDLTRAMIRVEAADSRWWRPRFVAALIKRVEPDADKHGEPRWKSYADWVFFNGGDRVIDHDDELGHWIEDAYDNEKLSRKIDADRAKLKNPWAEVVELPSARIVKP